MAKKILIIVIIFFILTVAFAGCIVKPPSSASNDQTSSSKTTSGKTTSTSQNSKTTTKTTIPTPTPTPFINPLFKVGQIASTSATATSGLAIVDYSNATGKYGTLEVKKNSVGDGWHTEGYQLIVWKTIKAVDSKYKFAINTIINPTNIPEYDSTSETNVFPSTPCDLVGDWRVNKGASIYKFRLDNIVVSQTGNKTLIGEWAPVKSKDRRDFVIRWRYSPYPNSTNYMEKITLSSDYSKFTSKNNYELPTISGEWIGLVPSWKAELDKAKPDKQTEVSVGADCYKWLGGNEWYNKL